MEQTKEAMLTESPAYVERTLGSDSAPLSHIQNALKSENGHPVPGCGALGMGVDIRKRYFKPTLSSLPVVNLGAESGKFRDYTVPANVRVIESGKSKTHYKTVYSREEFNNTFAAKAGLTISSFAFDGEFNAAYQKVTTGKAENFYSFYQYSSELWTLAATAKEPSSEFLKAVDSLPEKFEYRNAGRFFEVLRRFGTHYIDSITMGGNLVMYTAMSANSGFTSEKFEASMKLEYSALFTSAKSEASAEWSKVDKSLFKEQTFNLLCEGGDGNLATANISENSNYHDQFVAWQKSCEAKPSIVDYNLTPIAFAAPIERQRALLDAIDAYTKGTIQCTASISINGLHDRWDSRSDIAMYVGGKFVEPPMPTNNPNKRKERVWGVDCMMPFPVFRLTFVSQTVPYKILGDKVYQSNSSHAVMQIEDLANIYNQIAEDIKNFSAKAENRYYASFAVTGLPSNLVPSQQLAHWLKSIGAGKLVDTWLDKSKEPYGSNNICFYTCAGKSGAMKDSASEDYYSVILHRTNVLNKQLRAESLITFPNND